MNKSVINLIAETYGLSVDQEERLNNCSAESLEYAVKELFRQKQTTTINNPVNWIAKVAAAYKPGSASFPKRGRLNDFQKKVVNGVMNINHSPQSGANPNNPDDPLNLTMEERVEFCNRQINEFDAILNEGDNLSVLFSDTPRVRGGGFRSIGEVMRGWAPNMKERWTNLKKNPKSIPPLLNGFKIDYEEACKHAEDEEYERHLDEISKDKYDPEGYKIMVRKYDYRRTYRPR